MSVLTNHAYVFEKETFIKRQSMKSSSLGAPDNPLIETWNSQTVKNFPVHSYSRGSIMRQIDLNVAEGGDQVCTVSGLAKDKGGGFTAYYLPYANDKMYWTNIGSECGFFFTAQLNGCAIFITNDTDNPKIYHCNYIPEMEGTSSKARANQLKAQSVFYDWVQDKLSPQGNLKAFRPEFYLDDSKFPTFLAGVYGFKDEESHLWTFYYQIVLSAQPKKKGIEATKAGPKYIVTDKLWP